MEAVQKEIFTKLVKHFLAKTPEWVILRNDFHRPYGPQSLTYFLFWMAKENPELLNQITPTISDLHRSSGLIGTGEPISLEYFWTFYFLYTLTSSDDDQNTVNQFGIDTSKVQPFREGVLSHINGLVQDCFQSQLSPNSRLSDDDIHRRYLTQASEIIQKGANLLTQDQLNTLLTRVNLCLKNINLQISNYAQPETNSRLRADQILKLALSLSDIAKERFTSLTTIAKTIRTNVETANNNLHQAETDLVTTAVTLSS